MIEGAALTWRAGNRFSPHIYPIYPRFVDIAFVVFFGVIAKDKPIMRSMQCRQLWL